MFMSANKDIQTHNFLETPEFSVVGGRKPNKGLKPLISAENSQNTADMGVGADVVTDLLECVD